MAATEQMKETRAMQRLREVLSELGLDFTEKMIAQFSAYMDEILAWNEKLNLTAITERDEFVLKHFIDSVLTAGMEEVKTARRVADVGTGAGFPGVPLAILFPEKEFVLMDSLNKRLKVISDACAKTGISNVMTVHGRAEDLAHRVEHRETYDLCVSRAVANMATLAEYCLPFLKTGGAFLAYKGPDYGEELASSARALRILGGKLCEVRDAAPVGVDLAHKIIVVEKTKETPAKYPRKAGTPSKEPLK